MASTVPATDLLAVLFDPCCTKKGDDGHLAMMDSRSAGLRDSDRSKARYCAVVPLGG